MSASSALGCVSSDVRVLEEKEVSSKTLATVAPADAEMKKGMGGSPCGGADVSDAGSTDRRSCTALTNETPQKAKGVSDARQEEEDMRTPAAAMSAGSTPSPLSQTQSHSVFGQHPHQGPHHHHHQHHPHCLAHTPGTRKPPPMLPPNLHSMLYHGLITPDDAAAAMIALEASGKKKNRSAKATPCREGTSLNAVFTPDAPFQVTAAPHSEAASVNLMSTPHSRTHRKDASSNKRIIPYAMKPSTVAAGLAGNMSLQTPDQFCSLRSPVTTASPNAQNPASLPSAAVHAGRGGASGAPESGSTEAPRFGLPLHHVMVSQPRALDFSPFSDSTGSIGPACLSPATGGGQTIDKKLATALQSAGRGDSRFVTHGSTMHPSSAPIDGSTCRPLYPNDYLESPSYRPHSANRYAPHGTHVQAQTGSTTQSADFSTQGCFAGKETSVCGTAAGAAGLSSSAMDRDLQKQLLTANKEELVQMLLDLSSNHQDAAKLIQDKLYVQPTLPGNFQGAYVSEHIVAHVREQPASRFSISGLGSSSLSAGRMQQVGFVEKMVGAPRPAENVDVVSTPHAPSNAADGHSQEESPLGNPTPRKPLFATPTCDHTFRVAAGTSNGPDGVFRQESKTPMRDTLFGMHSKSTTENPRLVHPSALRMAASYVAPPAAYSAGKAKTPLRATADTPPQPQLACEGPEGRGFATEIHPCLLWYKGCRNSRSCIFAHSPQNLCLNWVRGSCAAGSECPGVHRLPSPCPPAIQTLFDLSRDASRTGLTAHLPAVLSVATPMAASAVLPVSANAQERNGGLSTTASEATTVKVPHAEFSAVKTPNSQLIREFPSRGVISANAADNYCEDEVDLSSALAGVPVRRNLENSFRRTVRENSDEGPEGENNSDAAKEGTPMASPSAVLFADEERDAGATDDLTKEHHSVDSFSSLSSPKESADHAVVGTGSDSSKHSTLAAADETASSSADRLDDLPATRAMTPENSQS